MIALKIAIKFLNNDNDKEYGYYSEKTPVIVTVQGGGGWVGAAQGRFSNFNWQC